MSMDRQRVTLCFALVLSHSDNKRESGSGFQPSPKLPLATSDTRYTLFENRG